MTNVGLQAGWFPLTLILSPRGEEIRMNAYPRLGDCSKILDKIQNWLIINMWAQREHIYPFWFWYSVFSPLLAGFSTFWFVLPMDRDSTRIIVSVLLMRPARGRMLISFGNSHSRSIKTTFQFLNTKDHLNLLKGFLLSMGIIPRIRLFLLMHRH